MHENATPTIRIELSDSEVECEAVAVEARSATICGREPLNIVVA